MKEKMLGRLNNLFAKIFLIIFVIGVSNSAFSEENKAKFIINIFQLFYQNF